LFAGTGSGWSGQFRQGVQALAGGQDQLGSGCVAGESEVDLPGVAGDAAGDGEQALGFPAAGFVLGEGEHLGPGGQLELGGAPRDPKNLWPEPRVGAGTTGSDRTAESKDKEENALKK